ncbi:Syntaxin-124 [Acorus gramineus]|uniref:Syntaxin-124 n=1 Tax=Acorus gramineus TaxID=55184 RepID=A0AAV9B554_ACOGR|nr:Syntaxin-124 [Acorus gramineus]
MNDLFSSSSFKKYTDLKRQTYLDNNDMEIGGGGINESVDLAKFFEEVEAVKEDLRTIEALYRRLQDSNQESSTIHDSRAMKALRSRMDSNVEKVLRCAKSVKAKLEALERSNANNRKLPGCGLGTSADRTRTSVVAALGKKLKDIMDDFQGLRDHMAAEYKETMQRRYFTITGEKGDEATIEALISSGESETFLQRAIQEQGRGKVLDTISEIQERRDAVREIERSLLDLHQVFLDMAALVEAQGHQLNDIESHVAHANSFVRRGNDELHSAKEYQKSSRKWACIAITLGAAIVIVIIIPILSSILR